MFKVTIISEIVNNCHWVLGNVEWWFERNDFNSQ